MLPRGGGAPAEPHLDADARVAMGDGLAAAAARGPARGRGAELGGAHPKRPEDTDGGRGRGRGMGVGRGIARVGLGSLDRGGVLVVVKIVVVDAQGPLETSAATAAAVLLVDLFVGRQGTQSGGQSST